MLLYDGRVVRSGVNIKRMVVKFLIRLEFARAEVQRDTKCQGSQCRLCWLQRLLAGHAGERFSKYLF